jgi:hypothetical protein
MARKSRRSARNRKLGDDDAIIPFGNLDAFSAAI